MKQQSVSFIKRGIVIVGLLAVGGYPAMSQAQVFYPATPEYHSALITNPIIEGSALPYATPVSAVQTPTIPPNAAFGLEHQSAYVVPSPRIITQQKMGLVPGVTNVTSLAPVAPSNSVGAGAFVATPAVVPSTRVSQPAVPNRSGPQALSSPNNELLEQHPDAAYTRFFTTVPTTTYSDELPLIVSVTS